MNSTAAADNSRSPSPLLQSAAAAVMHATAAGIHADHPDLSRTFVAITVAQAAAAVVGFLRSGRLRRGRLVVVNAVRGRRVGRTRFVGISWFPGLEVAE